jgi:hypothetical protein
MYCKDNPLKFIDINGDSLKVNDVSQNNTATTKMNQMVDKKTNGYYKTTVKNGNTILTSTGKNDPKNPMSKEGQAFVDGFNKVANSSNDTKINITDNDKNISVIDLNSKTLDIGDLKAVDDKNLPSKSGSGMMMHELIEQQGIQNGGDLYSGLGHSDGLHLENMIDNSHRDPTGYSEALTAGGTIRIMQIQVTDSNGNSKTVQIFLKDNNVVEARER